jgi:hypothetical protein
VSSDGRLSTTDAVKFDALVAAKAAELARTGDTSSLDVRRSKALGLIADQLLSGELDLDGCETEEANRIPAGTGSRSVVPVRKAASTTLFIHASLADLATTSTFAAIGEPGVGWVERHGPVRLETIREWLGETNATIRPVWDLNRTDAVDAHDPPEWMRELVINRDGHCAFPFCGTRARACDLDHIDPYVPLDEDGPPGQTSPENLAALCRRHHRCKTFTRWRYRRRRDGTYEWTDPGGTRFLVVPGHSTHQLPDEPRPL